MPTPSEIHNQSKLFLCCVGGTTEGGDTDVFVGGSGCEEVLVCVASGLVGCIDSSYVYGSTPEVYNGGFINTSKKVEGWNCRAAEESTVMRSTISLRARVYPLEVRYIRKKTSMC